MISFLVQIDVQTIDMTHKGEQFSMGGNKSNRLEINDATKMEEKWPKRYFD